MSHHPQVFADRIVNVAVTGALVRLELAVLTPPATEGAQPTLQPTQTLILPLDGFLASFGILNDLIKKMVTNGMLVPRPAEAAEASSATTTPL